ncbi:hypothetical protein HGH46_11740, partial [Treponema vincentii]
LLKVEDTENALRAYLKLTHDTIIARVEDEKKKLNSTILQTREAILAEVKDDKKELLGKLEVQAGAVRSFVAGGGAEGQMALTLNLPVMIDEATRNKLIKASSLEKVNAVYAKVKDTDYYGIKPDAGDAIKPLWEDARRAALLASQISLEADQIQFKSDNIFVNGKLKADYIDVLELAVKKTFTEKLVVQKLHIDSDDATHEDFEVEVNKDVGLLMRIARKTIFMVSPSGVVEMPDCVMRPETKISNISKKSVKGSSIDSCVREEENTYTSNTTTTETVTRNEPLGNPIKEGFTGFYNGVKIIDMVFETQNISLGLVEVVIEKHVENHAKSYLVFASYQKFRTIITRKIILETNAKIEMFEIREYFDTSKKYNEHKESVDMQTASDTPIGYTGQTTIRADTFPNTASFHKREKKTRYIKIAKDMSAWAVV